jgi:MinD-like ATPase involved in chromosome partitioning or flagellar assembly
MVMSDQHEGLPSSTEQPEKSKRKPISITRFGGNVHYPPSSGWRKAALDAGLNVGASYAEIIAYEREQCIECRDELRIIHGAPCIGTFSNKGGVGKSAFATLFAQMFLDMNPSRERPILIDVNTSMTTLDVLNGLRKEDFITGKYWTMETLHAFLAGHPNLDKIEFSEIDSKLAWRSNPQLPIIPLLVEARDWDSEGGLNGDQYILVLSILKRFFSIIVHDFGTDTRIELTKHALSQQQMLGVLTHNGLATTQFVAQTLEALYKNLLGLLFNTQVIFNLSYPPSREVERAIALEKAGKSLDTSLLGRLRSNNDGEIQTPGQALHVINEIIRIKQHISPLEYSDIHLVGFDPHLKRERRLDLDQVSQSVAAQLWTLLHWILYTRVNYEREYMSKLPSGTQIRREEMTLDTRKNQPSQVILKAS